MLVHGRTARQMQICERKEFLRSQPRICAKKAKPELGLRILLNAMNYLGATSAEASTGAGADTCGASAEALC